uniref:Tf2-1-like SH3-like domain-containing protein n=1 Tax=Hyaloperonospora arabidopsidis (strain Emoy2) TaxID=559515 RepID=M4BFF8_HYAAE
MLVFSASPTTILARMMTPSLTTLLSTANPPRHVLTNVGSSKLLPKYIGPFRALRRQGNAYTIEPPRRMRTHPTFYVGRLCPYFQYGPSSDDEDSPHVQESPLDSCACAPGDQSGRVVKRPLHSTERSLGELSPSRQQGNGHHARPEAVQGLNQHDPSHD